MALEEFRQHVEGFAHRNPYGSIGQLRGYFRVLPGVRMSLVISDHYGAELRGNSYVSRAIASRGPLHAMLRPHLVDDPQFREAVCLLDDAEREGKFVWLPYFGFNILRRAGFLETETDFLINELLLAGVVETVGRPGRHDQARRMTEVRLNRDHWWGKKHLRQRHYRADKNNGHTDRSG